MVEDFERLQLWFSEIRQKIRHRTLEFIEDVFIKKLITVHSKFFA